MNGQSGFRVIGKSYPRKDGWAKVTGTQLYPSDIRLPGMLRGRMLVSSQPHALVEVDASAAEGKGVVTLTYDDIPHTLYNERMYRSEKTFRDRTVLPRKARQVGEPIAAVAAESEEAAERALGDLKVRYVPLEATFDPREAERPGAASIHDEVLYGEETLRIANNVACICRFSYGDAETAFAASDVIVDNVFRTGRTYHATLEPRGCVCDPRADGSIEVWCTAQSIHNTRQLLSHIFDIPISRINVHNISSGGSFGCSIQTNTVIPICVALALKARRSVMLVATREDDMYDHCRYPTEIALKLGAMRDGTVTAAAMEVLTDIGSHYIQAHAFLEMPADACGILYKIQNIAYVGRAVYTNKAPACAMQGYGLPQATFAIESSMDILAERLKIDPIQFRLKNYIGPGDAYWVGGFGTQQTIKSSGVAELLREGAARIGWARRQTPGVGRGPTVRGVGMARGYNVSGTGSEPPRKTVEYSSAAVRINEDGSVDITTALMECGGGSHDAAAKIVAEELGVPLEKVNVRASDTATTGYDVCTHASRAVYVGAGAILKAARAARTKLLAVAGTLLDCPAEALRLEYRPDIGDAVVAVTAGPSRFIKAAEVARKAQLNNLGSILGFEGIKPTHSAPNFGVAFIEVEVNLETGEIKILRAVLGADAGTVINPELARGQIHGGLYRGLGYALVEETDYDRLSGRLTNHGLLTDYKMLGPLDLPDLGCVEEIFASSWEPTGPFGAKGLGEGMLNPIAPAVANAVYNATGVRFFEVPITPERVLAAITEAGGGGERG